MKLVQVKRLINPENLLKVQLKLATVMRKKIIKLIKETNMAIKPPNFAKDAVPTKAGWRHPRTNELLKAQNFTQDQIDEFLGEGKYAPPRRPRKPARPAFITE